MTNKLTRLKIIVRDVEKSLRLFVRVFFYFCIIDSNFIKLYGDKISEQILYYLFEKYFNYLASSKWIFAETMFFTSKLVKALIYPIFSSFDIKDTLIFQQ
jgi:hypothetical protein